MSLKRKLKIGIFTQGFYPVSAETIKATELFAFNLATGLEKKGHEVHVFGGHGTKGAFISHLPTTSKHTLENVINNPYPESAYVISHFRNFIEESNRQEFDLIHDQATWINLALACYSNAPVISTLHGIRPKSGWSEFYKSNSSVYYIAPSQFAKKESPDFRFFRVINHGIDLNVFQYSKDKVDGFLSIGRIIPDKGQLDAIQATKIAAENLVIAGYKPKYYFDDLYYEKVVQEAKEMPNVDFVGRTDHRNVPKLMAGKKALLMPIKNVEVFGLVMAEAMACGTPVIAYDREPVREIVKEGVSGFIVKKDDVFALADAMKKIDNIDRKKCREWAEKNFDLKQMVDNYEQAYLDIVNGRSA